MLFFLKFFTITIILFITLDYSNITVNSEITITASWTWGSRVTVVFDWDDKTDQSINIHPDAARNSTTSHIYTVPGTYIPKVNIFNYIDDCSNQTIQLKSPIIVDYVLQEFVLKGPQLSLLTHPDYQSTTHFIPIKFELCVLQEISTPIYAKMKINYGDGDQITTPFICNISSIGTEHNYCPTDYTFCSFAPEHKYYITGSIYVKAIIWNTINKLELAFEHLVYSEIKDVKQYLYVLPYGLNATSEIPNEFSQLWESPYYPLENNILFFSNMTYGHETNLTYWWNFGDNSTMITSEGFARHKFELPGEYQITVNVSNPLSTETINELINFVFASQTIFRQTGKILVQR